MTPSSPHTDQQCEERVARLESVVTSFDKLFGAWKPEVDTSLSSIKCELAKLNAYFDRDAKAPGASALGVLHSWSASGRSPTGVTTGGPAGHRSDNNHGIVRMGVYTPRLMARSWVQSYHLRHPRLTLLPTMHLVLLSLKSSLLIVIRVLGLR
jgi:hypothetical protein